MQAGKSNECLLKELSSSLDKLQDKFFGTHVPEKRGKKRDRPTTVSKSTRLAGLKQLDEIRKLSGEAKRQMYESGGSCLHEQILDVYDFFESVECVRKNGPSVLPAAAATPMILAHIWSSIHQKSKLHDLRSRALLACRPWSDYVTMGRDRDYVQFLPLFWFVVLLSLFFSQKNSCL